MNPATTDATPRRGAERDGRASDRDACAALVALAVREAVPGIAPVRFVERLGLGGAGVRPGPIGLLDLARAGTDRLPGGGFRAALDDGTGGQARHFCGIAAACLRFGPRLTRLISIHLRRDAPDSPDGIVTDLAIEFVGLLRRGELDVDASPDWLRRTLCESPTDPGADDAGPDDPGPVTPYA